MLFCRRFTGGSNGAWNLQRFGWEILRARLKVLNFTARADRTLSNSTWWKFPVVSGDLVMVYLDTSWVKGCCIAKARVRPAKLQIILHLRIYILIWKSAPSSIPPSLEPAASDNLIRWAIALAFAQLPGLRNWHFHAQVEKYAFIACSFCVSDRVVLVHLDLQIQAWILESYWRRCIPSIVSRLAHSLSPSLPKVWP